MQKLICFIVVLIVLFETNSSAQQFQAGLTAGAAATDIPGLTSGTHFNKLGFTVGGLVSTAISSKTVVQLEINYIQKGASQKPDSNNNGSFRFSFNYLEVPLIFRRHLHLMIFKKPSNQFDLEGGVSVAKLFSYTYIDQTHYAQTLPNNYYNKTDASLLVGLDYNFTSNFIFCFRYTNSVIPVIKKSPVTSNQLLFYSLNKGQNVVLQFTIKFVFSPNAKGQSPQ
jgi:hypothetical protein